MPVSLPLHGKKYFEEPPPRRIGVHAPFRDKDSALLLVKKQWRVDEDAPFPWGIIGGSAGADERTHAAWRREIKARIGLAGLNPGRLLVVDHVSRGTYPEGINFVYEARDGRCILPRDTELTLPPELPEYRFVTSDELGNYLSPDLVLRARAVLDALQKNVTLELVDGCLPGSPSGVPAG
ncbi:NUDIX domain-containing protein [Streptomyces niveus]|uniref:NUDIX domain-containing protein n=1 Tax=Streptomyces niveus TaxID=193462 RepID=UPI003683228A